MVPPVLAVIPQLWPVRSGGNEKALNLLHAVMFRPEQERELLYFPQWLSTYIGSVGKPLSMSFWVQWLLYEVCQLWSMHFVYLEQVHCHVQAAVTKFSKSLKFTEGFKIAPFKVHSRCLSPCPQLVGGCMQGCQVSTHIARTSVQ